MEFYQEQAIVQLYLEHLNMNITDFIIKKYYDFNKTTNSLLALIQARHNIAEIIHKDFY